MPVLERGKKIRFQTWAIATTSLLVVGLSVALLFTVFRTFAQVAETNALERFELIGQQAAMQLDNVVQQSGKLVVARASADPDQYANPVTGRLDTTRSVSTFLTSLGLDRNVYSHFFALQNDDFLQVIAVRGDARLQAALQAPSGTEYAVRHIQHNAAGERTDAYQFLDPKRAVIGQLTRPATLQPHTRPWYSGAIRQGGLFVAGAYAFASTGELGITVAAPLAGQAGVQGTDISLRTLQSYLATLALPPNGAIAIQDMDGNTLAFHGRGTRYADLQVAPMAPAAMLESPWLAVLKAPNPENPSSLRELGVAGDAGHPVARFVVAYKRLDAALGGEGSGGSGSAAGTVANAAGATNAAGGLRVVVWAPLSDFTGAFRAARGDVMVLTLAVLLILLPLAFLGSRQIANTLTGMSRDAERVMQLDFSGTPKRNTSFLYELSTLGDAQYVLLGAIRRRTEELKTSQEKLAGLVDNGVRLSREGDRTLLLRHILFGARSIANCSAATLFLKTERQTLAFAQRTNDDPLPTMEIPLRDADGRPVHHFVVSHVANDNVSVVIDDVYAETRFDLSGTRKFSEESGFRTVSMLTVPLSPRDGEVIGVIQLLNAMHPVTGEIIPFPRDLIAFVEALAAQSAVAIENQTLIESQKQLMDALIRLIAGAIDAKSPHTGGHCERVPELGMMLAEAASAAEHGPLAAFRFDTEDQWREFRVGAWLHDCGKVTTPEYVVDKATKLETIHNRIHEVRMRFEVLLRDARICQLEALAGGADPAQAQVDYDAACAQLRDDFAFIAECNLGAEFQSPANVQRLQHIAAQTWLRHFDDRLGLAHEELGRQPGPPPPLPALEPLLSDKPQHIIARTSAMQAALADPKWRFKIKVPEHLYNHGELYNLSISRGTLTEEERFKINEHVMQTLMMLEQLPLPSNLRRVPEYAGTHHETLTGSGYPRQLKAEDLSVPARIMVIADIFEALTASDRPYKKAKPLSEAVSILAGFRDRGHIDGDLFELFLTSGVYLRYAERFLRDEQRDGVEVGRFILQSAN